MVYNISHAACTTEVGVDHEVDLLLLLDLAMMFVGTRFIIIRGSFGFII